MAAAMGMSQTSIGLIWRAFGLQPHRATSFKLSSDPLFIDKVRDVVGLYLDPPERAVVLCVDEKSQIQALNRFGPILPMLPGTPERRSHDYVRHGTTSLFAALEVASGKVIGSLRRHHRASEFKAFLARIEAEVHTLLLMPPSLTDWVADDSLVAYLNDLVDELDLAPLLAAHDEPRGKPPYHPALMRCRSWPGGPSAQATDGGGSPDAVVMVSGAVPIGLSTALRGRRIR